MQDYIDHLDYVLTVVASIVGATLGIIAMYKKTIKSLSRFKIWTILRVIYSLFRTGTIPTPWDGSCPIFWHTGIAKDFQPELVDIYDFGMGNILKRMRAAESHSARFFVADFTGLKSVGNSFIETYTRWPKMLNEKSEVASIWYVIPDDVKGLNKFRSECARIDRPTFYIVSSQVEAPVMRTVCN